MSYRGKKRHAKSDNYQKSNNYSDLAIYTHIHRVRQRKGKT